MLNSSTLSINNSPIFFVDNNIANYPSDDITNPYSKNEESPYSTSYFPLLSPLIYNDFAHFDDEYNYPSNDEVALIQQMVESNTNSSIITEESASLEVTTTNKMNSDKKDEVTGIVDDIGADKILESNAGHGLKRRRTSNRDRHSKIRTAHGLRDRRMRLSLEVARKFFKLQDILGYDKASNTIEWLLTQSKPAIEELLQSKNGSPNGVTKCTISSTSDCEVESTVVERRMAISKGKKASTCVGKDTKQPKKKRMMISKEARKEKRENARVKAFEKMISRMVTKDSEKSTYLNHLTLGACEVIQKYNDPLPTLSCNQNVVTSSRRSTLSILNFDEKVNIAQ